MQEPSFENNSLLSEDGETFEGLVDEKMLSEEEKKQVEEFMKRIEFLDVKLINSYGSKAQKGISTFSASLLNSVKTNEFIEVGDSLKDLSDEISRTTKPKKKGIFGIFQSRKKKGTDLNADFEAAKANIERIEKDLVHHQKVLTKDVFIFDQMYEMNLELFKELTLYIIAGKKALEKTRSEKLLELKQKADATGDPFDLHKYMDYSDLCIRFERRLIDLETTRQVSLQMGPQIRLLQNANQRMADKLRSDIINTIPLWKNQMVISVGIEQAITSIKEVVRLHEEGSKNFDKAREELTKIQEELKNVARNIELRY